MLKTNKPPSLSSLPALKRNEKSYEVTFYGKYDDCSHFALSSYHYSFNTHPLNTLYTAFQFYSQHAPPSFQYSQHPLLPLPLAGTLKDAKAEIAHVQSEAAKVTGTFTTVPRLCLLALTLSYSHTIGIIDTTKNY